MSPIYCYRRPDGVVVEQLYPMGEAPATVTCADGVEATRSIGDEGRGVRPDPAPGAWPYVSDSLGVLPEQIPAMKRAHPDHEFIETGENAGAMVFRDARHMDRCLKDLKADQYSDPNHVTRLTRTSNWV